MTDIDGMVKASKLLTRNYGRSEFLGVKWDGAADDIPMAGDTARMGYGGMLADNRPFACYEISTHVELGSTAWGEYGGSDYARSNHRSLLRDYPDVFVQVSGGYGSEYLALHVDQLITTDLFDTLVHLADEYPVYDEDDHSELISELVDEAWDGYLNWDVPRDLADRGITDEQLEVIGPDALRAEFYELTYSMPDYPHAESADSVVFPYMAETLDALVIWVREHVKAAEVEAIMELLKPGA